MFCRSWQGGLAFTMTARPNGLRDEHISPHRRRRRSGMRLLLGALLASVLTAALAVPASADTGWEGYGPTSWPGPSWRPYSGASPFNKSTTGVTVHPNSAAMVKEALQWGSPANLVDAAGAANDWARPTYYAQPSDPIFTLHSVGGNSEVEGLRIPIPTEAQPAGGGDAQMTVVTPDGWEYDFLGVQSKPAGGGTLTFVKGGRTRIDGNGLGSEATAAHFGN